MATRYRQAEPIVIAIGADSLSADLALPRHPRGLVLFAHGSGSSRLSPRNRLVAQWLGQARLGTLLLDLLTEREEATDRYSAEFRFDIPRLAERLLAATGWIARQPSLRALRLGYFGASTGAAAALMAAAERPPGLAAVVCRGGRPDLAGDALPRVRAPTLLIVGGNDPVVIDLNRQAQARLNCANRLEIVPGATHLFEEPGALEWVGELARNWFSARFHGRAASRSSQPPVKPP